MVKRRGRRGEGTVYWSKADQRWVARWPLGVVDGRRQDKRVKCRTRQEADDELDRLRRLYGQGGHATNDSLGEFLREWLESIRADVRPGTWTSYEGHVRLHISPLLGGIPVSRLQPSDVRRLKADLLAKRSAKGKRPEDRKPLSPTTVGRILTTLSIALETGVGVVITSNAASRVPHPLPAEHEVEPMTDEAATLLIAAFDGHWAQPLVRVLAGSGMRLGEALSLDQRDVFPDKRFVRLRRRDDPRRRGPSLKTGSRAVPITADAAEAIREAVRLAPRVGPGEPVFFAPRKNRDGVRDRLSGASVSHAVPEVVEAAGLSRLTPHGFRHGMATRLVSKGVHMRVVSEQLGHRNPTLTARLYAHVVPQVQRDAVGLLDAADGGPD